MRTLPVIAAFSHALRSTFNNLGFAFHVSWPWMLALLPVLLAGNFYLVFVNPMIPGQIPSPMTYVALIAMGIASVVAFASIAVNWHRYILLDEVPHGMQRLRLDGTVWRYIGNVILIGLMLALITIPAALAAGLLSLISPYLAVAIVLFIPVLLWLSYRLGIKLPSIALERRDFGFKQALAVSKGNFWPFVGLGFLIIGIALLVGMLFQGVTYVLGLVIGTSALAALVIVQLAVNWVSTIFSITVLTSLYGYFVEERNF
jgi:hypothetical protein